MRDFNALDVYLNEEPVGTLTQLPHDRIVFNFSDDYAHKKNPPVLSQSFYNHKKELILTTKTTQTTSPTYFSNLLPEGHLRRYLAVQAKVNESRDFPLLQLLRNDLPGAIILKPALQAHCPETEIEKQLAEDFLDEAILKFSLAGVQLKLSALMEARGGLTIPAHGVGGDWIIKLPSMHFQHVIENEFSMLTLAKSIGIEVPKIKLIPSKEINNLPEIADHFSGKVLGIKRFDRDKKERIHTEDFAQVFGVYPQKKYEGVNYSNLAYMINTVSGLEQVSEFIQRLIFNLLIGNGDMHLKNWSFIYRDKITPTLAPAYDYLATHIFIPEDMLALNFGDEKNIQKINRDHIKRFSEKALLPERFVNQLVDKTVTLTLEKWKKLKSEFPLNQSTLKKIETHIFGVARNLRSL